MFDPFENKKQKTEIYQPPVGEAGFPDFINTQWPIPSFEEGIKTKIGNNLEKGTDILKKASNFYFFALGLIALIIFFPTIIRFLYEISSWLYEVIGKLFL